MLIVLKKKEQGTKVDQRQNSRSRSNLRKTYGKQHPSQNTEKIDNSHLNSSNNEKPRRTNTDNNRHKSRKKQKITLKTQIAMQENSEKLP